MHVEVRLKDCLKKHAFITNRNAVQELLQHTLYM